MRCDALRCVEPVETSPPLDDKPVETSLVELDVMSVKVIKKRSLSAVRHVTEKNQSIQILIRLSLYGIYFKLYQLFFLPTSCPSGTANPRIRNRELSPTKSDSYFLRKIQNPDSDGDKRERMDVFWES